MLAGLLAGFFLNTRRWPFSILQLLNLKKVRITGFPINLPFTDLKSVFTAVKKTVRQHHHDWVSSSITDVFDVCRTFTKCKQMPTFSLGCLCASSRMPTWLRVSGCMCARSCRSKNYFSFVRCRSGDCVMSRRHPLCLFALGHSGTRHAAGIATSLHQHL